VSDDAIMLAKGQKLILVDLKTGELLWSSVLDLRGYSFNHYDQSISDTPELVHFRNRWAAAWTDKSIQLFDLNSGLPVTKTIDIDSFNDEGSFGNEEYDSDRDKPKRIVRADIDNIGQLQLHIQLEPDEKSFDQPDARHSDSCRGWLLTRKPPSGDAFVKLFLENPERFTGFSSINHYFSLIPRLDNIRFSASESVRPLILSLLGASSSSVRVQKMDLSNADNIGVQVSYLGQEVTVKLSDSNLDASIPVASEIIKQWPTNTQLRLKTVDLSDPGDISIIETYRDQDVIIFFGSADFERKIKTLAQGMEKWAFDAPCGVFMINLESLSDIQVTRNEEPCEHH
jgi:hypothetical protein